MTVPVLNTPSVELPLLAGTESALWTTLMEVCETFPAYWTLIGGQMVLLHAIEHGRTPPRVSTDLDALVNARILGVPRFVNQLEGIGFALEGISTDGRAHRYNREGVSVDVLAPEGLGPRTDLSTTPPGRTIQVPGGTQALSRTELLPISFAGASGLVPRPSLLGAVIAKAVAVGLDGKSGIHRQDLAFLLSLVGEPMEMAETMTQKDRKRLLARSELLDEEHRAWASLTGLHADNAQAALRILLRG